MAPKVLLPLLLASALVLAQIVHQYVRGNAVQLRTAAAALKMPTAGRHGARLRAAATPATPATPTTRAALKPPSLRSDGIHAWLVYRRELALARGDRATFVQVGANNGWKNDPLIDVLRGKASWRGYPVRGKEAWVAIQVEPTPSLFADLTAFHNDTVEWTFVNGVVASTCDAGGTRTFNAVKPGLVGVGGVPGAAAIGQMNSLNLDHLDPKWTIQVQAACVSSMEALIAEHGSAAMQAIARRRAAAMAHDPLEAARRAAPTQFRIDVLQIDVEGFDADVLQTLDFATVRPAIIEYERVALKGKENVALVSKLRKNGYFVHTAGYDVLAIDVWQTGLVLEDPTAVVMEFLKDNDDATHTGRWKGGVRKGSGWGGEK